ncbi:TlpA family protein disulfide reductase [Algibacter pacificus]|uniref:TlpA family protein disulfide reductase n=1 Tax=Algibacter pacificus TaxID=2599389 RepID=UPI0016501AFF|nr:TlpA disulfide reductase family protein [Algibacter pacificus]
MKIKKQLLYLLFVLIPSLFFGQIHISNKIKESSIATTEDNALYFIDFWATWCGPCIHVSKYLESLQKQFPENFYILSLTKENEDVVNRFMAKNTMGLAVGIDFEGETFAKNNISTLPYGILFNAEGKKLWEGHAAELKSYDIASYLRANKTTISIENFFKLEAYKQEVVVDNDDNKRKSFSVLELDVDPEINSGIQMVTKHGFLEIEGRLQDILAYALHCNKAQIKIPTEVNKYYKMSFEEGSKAFENKETYISRALKLKEKIFEKEGEVFFLNIDNPNFWDTNQIEWGVGNPKYLIGDSDIQADNVSFNDVFYQLSNLLERPIIVNENYEADSTLHDWQIHYKYFEFMSTNLEEYGVKIEKKVATYPEYVYRAR